MHSRWRATEQTSNIESSAFFSPSSVVCISYRAQLLTSVDGKHNGMFPSREKANRLCPLPLVQLGHLLFPSVPQDTH
jgi:hypothetical protein